MNYYYFYHCCSKISIAPASHWQQSTGRPDKQRCINNNKYINICIYIYLQSIIQFMHINVQVVRHLHIHFIIMRSTGSGSHAPNRVNLVRSFMIMMMIIMIIECTFFASDCLRRRALRIRPKFSFPSSHLFLFAMPMPIYINAIK